MHECVHKYGPHANITVAFIVVSLSQQWSYAVYTALYFVFEIGIQKCTFYRLRKIFMEIKGHFQTLTKREMGQRE